MTDARARLLEARLYLVVEAAPARGLEQVVGAALAGGADAVQLRDKRASDAELLSAAARVRRLCDAHGALLVVNDRPDLAVAAGADGVHLGQDDMPVEDARRIVGGRLIGLSTHSPDQVDAAARTSADYIGVGPVFATATKPGLAPVGLELVAHAAAHAACPFFAIGGIDRGNAGRVAAAGARRIAVVRALRDAADPRAAAAALRAAVTEEVPVGAAG